MKNATNNEKSNSSEASSLILWRLGIGAILFMLAGLVIDREPFKSLTYLSAVLLLCYDIAITAFKKLISERSVDNSLLITIAAFAAFVIGEHPESVGILIFYRLLGYVSDYVRTKSDGATDDIMSIRPDHANVERNGSIVTVKPEDVRVGETIVVKSGERIPLDGIVTLGESFTDTRILTGESIPVPAKPGTHVLSGSVNAGSPLYIRVDSEYKDSAAAKILKLTELSKEKKSKSENFASRFSRLYTPIIVFAAVILMLLPPLFDGFSFVKWIYRGVVLLAVSASSALAVSVSVGFASGTARASKDGILIRNGRFIELLSKLGTVVFDKTGTLTKGVFEIREIHEEESGSGLLEAAAYAEYYSNHPAARAICSSFSQPIDKSRISDYKEFSGKGVSIRLDGTEILAGNLQLMTDNRVYAAKHAEKSGTLIYIAINRNYAGYILVNDEERPDSIVAVSGMTARGIQTVMLTGDSTDSAERIAAHLGISKTHAELLPYDKVTCMEGIMKRRKKPCAFVGDGLNDAPAIALADVGVAMGITGSAGAIDAADVILMTDEPSKLLKAIDISRKTMRVVKQNTIAVTAIKLIIAVLAVFGIVGIWSAVFIEAVAAIVCLLRPLKLLKR